MDTYVHRYDYGYEYTAHVPDERIASAATITLVFIGEGGDILSLDASSTAADTVSATIPRKFFENTGTYTVYAVIDGDDYRATYKIGTVRVFNNVLPAPLPNTLYLAFVSDMHYGQDGSTATSAFTYLNSLNWQNYEKLFLLGDMFIGSDPTTAPTNINTFVESLDVDVDKVFVWGNHDFSNENNTYTDNKALLTNYGYDAEHPKTYSFTLKGGRYSLITVNNCMGTWDSYVIEQKELSDLTTLLDNGVGRKYILCHIPVVDVSSGQNMGFSNPEQLSYLASQYPDFVAFISAHDHNAVGVHEGVLPAIDELVGRYEGEEHHEGDSVAIEDENASNGACAYNPCDGSTSSIALYFLNITLPAGSYVMRARMRSDEYVVDGFEYMVWDSEQTYYIVPYVTIPGYPEYTWSHFIPFSLDEQRNLWIKVRAKKYTDNIGRYVDCLDIFTTTTATFKQIFTRRAGGNWGVDEGYSVLKLNGTSEEFWTHKFGDDVKYDSAVLRES